MKRTRRCWPWRHDWNVRKITVPMWDPWSRGVLKTCRKCSAAVVK